MERCTVFRGHARFVSPHEISVDDVILSADQIFINVGGRANVPSMPGIENIRYLTNSTIMEVDFLPEHLSGRGRQLYRAWSSPRCTGVLELG